MPTLAISNSQGQHQVSIGETPVVLAQIGNSGEWSPQEKLANGAQQQSATDSMHENQLLVSCHDSATIEIDASTFSEERVRFKLTLPAVFYVDGTRFEVTDGAQTKVFPSALLDNRSDLALTDADEREVSVLFADLRNFSSICAALETVDSYRLLNEIMDCLTSAVMDHGGLVIDYYGDGLSAMWNAPQSQEHHALYACRAALQMLEDLPAVNQTWQQRLPRDLRLGIGIHTGLAQVGNIGSRRCVKYGPRGTTVNLASRIEAATKKIRVPLLVTDSVATRITGLPAPPEMIAYRTCQANLKGIPESIDLYAVARPVTAESKLDDIERYEKALDLFERGNLKAAENLLKDTGADDYVPIRFLAEHVHSLQCQQLGRRESDQTDATHRTTIPLDMK